MNTRNSSRKGNAARISKYVLVVALTLIAGLIIPGKRIPLIPGRRDIPSVRVLASGLPDGDVFASAGGIERGIDAASARWSALGEYYLAKADADSARWVALGEFYLAKDRGIDADSARWVALGEYYTAKAAAVQRGIDASTARYQAMGRLYPSDLAANPELSAARRFYHDSNVLALNPELSAARRGYLGSEAVACNLKVDEGKLVDNPELAFLNRLEAC